MKAKDMLATVATATFLTLGAFVVGGCISEDSSATPEDRAAETATEESAKRVPSEASPTSERTSGGEVAAEPTAEHYERTYEGSVPEPHSIGESATIDDGRNRQAEIMLTDVHWDSNYGTDPEYLSVYLRLTNTGDGLLFYDRGDSENVYVVTDEVDTTVAQGSPLFSGTDPSLAPGSSVEERIATLDIPPEAAGMELTFFVYLFGHSGTTYTFTVPDPEQEIRESEGVEAEIRLGEALEELEENTESVESNVRDMNERLVEYRDELSATESETQSLRQTISSNPGDCFEIQNTYSSGPNLSVFAAQANLDAFTTSENSMEGSIKDTRESIEGAQEALSDQQEAIEAAEGMSASSGYGPEDVSSSVLEAEQTMEDARAALNEASTQIDSLNRELEQIGQTAERLVEEAGCEVY